jgi:iron complex outermembrane receptor protein
MYWADQDTDSVYDGIFYDSVSAVSVDKSSFGAYISDEFSLLDNLILSLGARRERVKYDLEHKGSLDESVTETENGFNAGLTYLYSDTSSVFVRANRSYRFPLTDEFILYFPTSVNEDLKPQTGRHYEVGIKHHFTENIRANVTLFRAEIKDEIFYDPLTFQNTNHPETLHQGIELGIRADFIDKVTIIGNYTYTDAEFEKAPYSGNSIPAVPEHTAHIGISIHDVIPGFVFSTSYNYVGSSYLISDQAHALKKMDDYHTVDCKLSYKIKDIEAFFGINNLTNEDYSEYGVRGSFAPTRNFYPAPDRNWFLGLNYAM